MCAVPDQTIKAQLIYVSFFEDKPEPDYLEYAGWFALSESDFELVARLNLEYDLNIVYEEFMKTYTFVMNQTINPYLFTDANTKNAADLAASADSCFDLDIEPDDIDVSDTVTVVWEIK